MAFVAFTTAEVDADSPLNETFFTKMKDNFDVLNGADVTNGDLHNHEAGDGAVIPQAGLKTTTGSVNVTASRAVLTLPGGEYGFYPRLKMSITTARAWEAHILTSVSRPGWTSYVTTIELNTTANTIYALQRYFQASPPYKMGGEVWGHFLYLLVNSQGDVVSSYEAEDPPYAYNGPSHNAKDSIERIMAVPHPFADYYDRDPAIDGLEIVLVDLRGNDVKKWKSDNAKQGKGILEDLAGNITPGGIILPPQSLGLPDIPGFTNKVKIRRPQ